MADLNPKFIVFNNVIINATHILWCELVENGFNGYETTEYGIKIVVNKSDKSEEFFKWFDNQVDRNSEYEYLSNVILRAFVV